MTPVPVNRSSSYNRINTGKKSQDAASLLAEKNAAELTKSMEKKSLKQQEKELKRIMQS